VTRRRLALLLLLAAGVSPAQEPAEPQEPDLPEEDEDLVRKTEYTFNPIQAHKEFKVGEFYWKKKSYRAAAGRYEEAVKWDPGFAEAYWKLALAKEKLAAEQMLDSEKSLSLEDARRALRKYLEVAPDGKHAKEARRKLAKIEDRLSD